MILHELKAIGVRVALDDFNTGYSSPSYLRRFRFDKIKIDRSFISDLTEEDSSSSIVRAVVTMAAEHKIVTTAEGVGDTRAGTNTDGPELLGNAGLPVQSGTSRS